MKTYVKILFFLLLGSILAQAQRRTYEYDDLNRLNKVNVWVGSSIAHTITYTYDEIGNRMSKIIYAPSFSGLMGYYTFTGNANDISGNNNTGTPQNGVSLNSGVKGETNGAYCFDGVDDYINTPIQQNNVVSYSISAWVKTNLVQSAGNAQVIVQTRGAVNAGGRSLTLGYDKNLGKWFFAMDTDFTIVGTALSMNNNNQWMHIAGTWSGTAGSIISPNQFKLYINGVLQTSTDYGSNGSITAPISGLGTTKIGYSEPWNSYFQGCIDNVRIYQNQTLSDAEITTIYNDEKPCLPTASLSGTQTITSGQSANLSVAFTGASPYTLVMNGQTYSNITANPYTISVSPTSTTTYTLTSVSNTCGAGSVSGSANVTVNPPCNLPTATLSGTQTINAGQTANLSIAFTGNSPYYFIMNGMTYGNIISSPFIVSVTPSTTTTYTLSHVNNSCGTGTVSGSATITVNPVSCDAFEPNDDIANAKLISGTSYISPNLCLNSNNDNDWYKWVYGGKTYYILVHPWGYNTSGNYKFTLSVIGSQLNFETMPTVAGENIDTYLRLYDSDGTTQLTFNDDIGGSPWSNYSKITYDMPITCTDKPDLVIIDMPITEYKSNQLKYTVQIKNTGGTTASLGSVSYYSYTSPDAIYNNGNDRFVNGLFIGGSLGSGQVLNLNWQGEFKYDANYYLIGVIDYHSLLTECLETNNTFVKLANACTGTNLTLSGSIPAGYYSTNGYVQINGQATSTGNVMVVGKSITSTPVFLGTNITLQTGSCLNATNAPISVLSNSEKTTFDVKNPKTNVQQVQQSVNLSNTLNIETSSQGQLEAVFKLAVPQKISLTVWSEKDKSLFSEPIQSIEYQAGEYRKTINTDGWIKGQKYLVHLNKPTNLDVAVIEW